jgi:neutral ceramidase
MPADSERVHIWQLSLCREHRNTDVKNIRVLAAIVCGLILSRAGLANEEWYAGVAEVVITPTEPMWMSGYASRDRPADGTIHDLKAKAILLEDPQGTQLLLISLDLVGIDRQTSQQICERLMKAHGLSRSQIAVATSHTHSGPVVGTNLLTMYALDEQNLQRIENYTHFLIESVERAAANAMASRAPARLQAGEGTATFAVNRRNNREAEIQMLRDTGQLVGPVDHTVPVLAVREPAGKLRAVVFGYACHATVLSGLQWCGDWPGFAQLEIEKNHPGAIAVFWAGCGADQNPLPRRTVEHAVAYGQQMAASIDRTLQSPMPAVNGALNSVYREIPLALATLPTEDEIQNDLKSDNVYIVRRAAVLLSQLQRDGKLPQTYDYPVQMWHIGDTANLTFLGGEVVVDYSLRLKTELGEHFNWIAGYSNDVMAYIPSKRVLLEGGYEGETAMIYYGLPAKWSEDVEEHIVRTVKELHTELQTETSAGLANP